jgi:hypothetical protein
VATNSGLSAPSSPASGAPSTPAIGASSSSMLLSTEAGSSSNMASGIPMSHTIYNISIKSLMSYTHDLESHNYSKWCTLFTMVLERFNLLPHILEDTTHTDDVEWNKENLLVDNWLYCILFENLMDMCMQLRIPTARQI